jgi:hypothetical protein
VERLLEAILLQAEVLELKANPNKPATGAVAVARHPEHGYVVKRMGRPTAVGTPLMSLNPAYPTLMLPPGSGAVIGRVVVRWCGHGGTKPTLAPAP